eukprot:scaffold8248_cov258-Pinguiococcus_pyrenoidosus.AAC.1
MDDVHENACRQLARQYGNALGPLQKSTGKLATRRNFARGQVDVDELVRMLAVADLQPRLGGRLLCVGRGGHEDSARGMAAEQAEQKRL